MQTPAEQAPVTEQLTASKQPVPDSMQLITTCAAVHTAWEQNWGTVSEHEEGIHNQTSSSSGPRDSWGAKLHCNSPGVYSRQFNSRVADQLQASKVTFWEAATTDCQHALLQLEKAMGIKHSSSITPEQAISQYHPSAALEFKKQTQGIAAAEGLVKTAGVAEKAQMEVERRMTAARGQHHYCTGAESAMVRSWLDRAQQTAELAQQFEQAAIESVDVLEAVLSGSWDRRVASKLHNDQLRKMELEPAETLILDLHRHDASFHGLEATAAEIQWTRHQARRQEQQVRMHR